MTNSSDRVEIITSVQRRRRWTAPEKVRMVEETFEPGMTVSLVARRHGRSNLADRLQERSKKRIGRPPLPDEELVSKIKAVIAELATYGYRRVHAVLKRQALAAGLKPPNHKRVYRVMKAHGLLLDRHVGGDERRHDGRIAVDERNRRWCSDGFEIGCDNGERVRVVAFTGPGPSSPVAGIGGMSPSPAGSSKRGDYP